MTTQNGNIKTIEVVIAGKEGDDAIRRLELEPRTLVADVIRDLAAGDLELLKPDKTAYGRLENLYDAVEDKQKVLSRKSNMTAG